MSVVGMSVLLTSLLGLFAWSAHRRWALLMVGDATWGSRFDRWGERLRQVAVFALYQKKMRYYLLAGVAHNLIFAGFVVLLLRSLILWGRGFDPEFNLWILGPQTPLGDLYSFLKDIFALLVLCGVSIFVYFRAINPQKRMAQGVEGLVILGIIAVMMLSDLLYDGAAMALSVRFAEVCGDSAGSAACLAARTVIAPLGTPAAEVAYHFFPEPGGSLFAVALKDVNPSRLVGLAHLGYWLHSALVLVFLNILPYSKHFHIITAIPNVFLGDLTPKGRLKPLAATTDALLEKVELASEDEQSMEQARIGYGKIEHFSWKDNLDFFSCTECGRCTDHCPAAQTGKKLSPKHLTLALRDELYRHQDEVMQLVSLRKKDGTRLAPPSSSRSEPAAIPSEAPGGIFARTGPIDSRGLVPEVIDPDVLWACTTCRACEEQCPVNISYVDKIVQMRRNQVTMLGEFPTELAKPFEGMETNGNPWNLSRLDRTKWTDGLSISHAADHPSAPVLYWVGCAASYDDRAKKIARATSELLLAAGVDFAILAEEENCTGDPARRAGNEYLYSMLAESNVETLNKYKRQGGVQTIVTTCPHCFNTIKNEYPDFGARFEVVHHTDFLLSLLAEKKLQAKNAVHARVAYHDSCYLGRYNDIYDSPRQLLESIEGVTLAEAEPNKNKGLCCGAGGAQMWMEEQTSDRVNVKRTGQLLETGADTISSACPFCMTMLTDGLKAQSKESEVRTMDVVELLAQACL